MFNNLYYNLAIQALKAPQKFLVPYNGLLLLPTSLYGVVAPTSANGNILNTNLQTEQRFWCMRAERSVGPQNNFGSQVPYAYSSWFERCQLSVGLRAGVYSANHQYQAFTRFIDLDDPNLQKIPEGMCK